MTYLGDLINPLMNVTVDTVVYPDVSNAVIELSNNANGTVVITVDGKTFTGIVDNGEVSVDLGDLSAGVKEAVVEFISSDVNVNNVTQKVRFVVEKASSSLVVSQDGSDVVVSVDATGNVTVYVNGNEYLVPINDGKAILSNVLSSGNYSVVAVYDGDVNFTGSRDKMFISITSSTSEVQPNVTKEGNDTFVDIPVPEGQTGVVTVVINGTNYTVPIVNGTAKLNVTGLDVGDDPINVTYRDSVIIP